MYIDNSFQLLSADSSKLATEEPRLQEPTEGDVEFSDVLGAELDSQEQQSTVLTEKKSGQEIAAILTQQAKAAEQQLADKALVAVGLAEKSLAENKVDIKTAGDDSHFDANELVKQAETTVNTSAVVDDKGIAQPTLLDMDAEQATKQNPWLAIINQSHDFNAILSQSAAVASTNDAKLSKTENLVAELLGLPVSEPEHTTVDQAISPSDQAAQPSNELGNIVGGSAKTSEDTGNTATGVSLAQSTQADTSGLKNVPGQPDAKHLSGLPQSDPAVGIKGRVVTNKMVKLPAEQVSLQEHVKTDKPHAMTTAVTGSDSSAIDAAVAPHTAEDAAMQKLTGKNAATSPVADSASPAELKISAETVAGQLNLAEKHAPKAPATAPVEVELPITVTMDENTPGALTTVAAVPVTSPAKNAPQSFAQFQKAANAAASSVQKQLQAEQSQSQPLQELAAQQPVKVAELSVMMSGQHTETPTAFNALLQTERPISSSGSAMGSSTGQQQQQAASQLFAAKLNDHITSNEQPPLNLLEPSAATQLKERVMFQVNQKIQSAEIRLAPEELGSMQIKVQMQQEQLSVQFVVQQAGAKEALEQQMPRLREMLEEQGIELTQGQVSQQREGSGEQRSTRERHQSLDQGPEIGDEPLQQQAMVRVSDRMVDYYA